MNIFSSFFSETSSGNSLNTVINQLFYIGLIAAVILAVIMIIIAGIQYMTTDAISGKDTAKRRIRAAMGGLLLAFSGVLILNTINPGITGSEANFNTNIVIGAYGPTPEETLEDKFPGGISMKQKYLLHSQQMVDYLKENPEVAQALIAKSINQRPTTEQGERYVTDILFTFLQQDQRGHASSVQTEITQILVNAAPEHIRKYVTEVHGARVGLNLFDESQVGDFQYNRKIYGDFDTEKVNNNIGLVADLFEHNDTDGLKALIAGNGGTRSLDNPFLHGINDVLINPNPDQNPDVITIKDGWKRLMDEIYNDVDY